MKKQSVKYPKNLLRPVSKSLKGELADLRKQKKEIEEGDPFSNPERALDNAAIDTDAEEQSGHVRYVAMKAVIDRKIIQTRKALAQIKIGRYGNCVKCSKMINTDRLMIYPEATYCIKCERKIEKKN